MSQQGPEFQNLTQQKKKKKKKTEVGF
jgi:hypothetical protein